MIAFLKQVGRLEKALFELEYELNYRPDWVRIPMAGILHLIRDEDRSGADSPDQVE